MDRLLADPRARFVGASADHVVVSSHEADGGVHLLRRPLDGQVNPYQPILLGLAAGRPVFGADLDDPVAGLRDGQPCDPRRRSGVHEKVLAEPFLGAQSAPAQQRPRARSVVGYLSKYTVTGRRPNRNAAASELKPRSIRRPRIAPPVSPAIALP